MQWVPVEDYKTTDQKVYNGQDYHTLTWEKRAIDLDDLIADDGYVVTGLNINTIHLIEHKILLLSLIFLSGVRFKTIGTHLNFEIFITPFDFESGQLIDPIHKSIFKDNPNTDSSQKNPR